MNTEKLNFIFPSKAKLTAFIFMAVGLISIIAMFLTDHVEGDANYHLNRAWSNVFAGSFSLWPYHWQQLFLRLAICR